MWKAEHYRICGYAATLTMHIGNTIITKMGGRDKEVLKDPDVRNMFAMEDTFFTLWNIFFQMVYSGFGLYCEIGSLLDKKQKKWSVYLRYRKTFFSTILWPATWFVFTAFWVLFLYDRSLIFPEFVDKVVSKGSNLVIHFAIVPVVLWEMTFLPINAPLSHRKNLAMTGSLMSIYLVWIIYTYYARNLWPYPILKMIYGTVYFPICVSIAFAVTFLHYYLHWHLRRLVYNIRNNKSN